MAHNIQTMAYYGDIPWHGLGKRIPERATSERMIEAAGLDWLVEKRPARGANIDKKGRANRYEIIRVPREDMKEQEVLFGVVRDRYEPLQNHEAFQFFDPIVAENRACFETAGALGGGERIWVMAKMPDSIEVVRDDECMKYLLLSNSHDGQGAVIIKFTSIRVVCQNTLMLAMEDGQRAYRVRHSKSMTERLQQVAEILAAVKEIYKRAAEQFRALAKLSLTSALIHTYLDGVYPRTKTQLRERTWPPRWIEIEEILGTKPDLQLPGVRDTMWALYNAVARFEDYRQVRDDETSESRLNRVWFGKGADIKLLALNKAVEMLAAA